jgi:orotate phosphoribosyltransferase
VDHAQELARAVAAALELPLVRTLRARTAGDGRDRYDGTRPLPGTVLLLVDDVLTTGATAVRAATALQGAGADVPHLAVLARAGPHPLSGGLPAEPDGGTGVRSEGPAVRPIPGSRPAARRGW